MKLIPLRRGTVSEGSFDNCIVVDHGQWDMLELLIGKNAVAEYYSFGRSMWLYDGWDKDIESIERVIAFVNKYGIDIGSVGSHAELIMLIEQGYITDRSALA